VFREFLCASGRGTKVSLVARFIFTSRLWCRIIVTVRRRNGGPPLQRVLTTPGRKRRKQSRLSRDRKPRWCWGPTRFRPSRGRRDFFYRKMNTVLSAHQGALSRSGLLELVEYDPVSILNRGRDLSVSLATVTQTICPFWVQRRRKVAAALERIAQTSPELALERRGF
jgi:hypothetical protein